MRAAIHAPFFALLLTIACGDSGTQPQGGGAPGDGGANPGGSGGNGADGAGAQGASGGAGAGEVGGSGGNGGGGGANGGAGGVGGSPACTTASEDADCGADLPCKLNVCDAGACAVEWVAQGTDCDGAAGAKVCDGFSGCKPVGPDHQWSLRAGDATPAAMFEEPFGEVAADAAGNVILGGWFYNGLDLGGGTLTSAGASDVLVAKLDPSGNHLWSKRFGSSSYEEAWDVVVDADGNVIVVGGLLGSADFGGGLLTNVGLWDFFVVKLDPDGNHLWSRRFGGNVDTVAATGAAVDSQGNAVVVGYFADVVDFGGGPLVAGTETDGFVLKLDADGDYLWDAVLQGPESQQLRGVAVDGDDDVIVTGDISGSASIGGPVMTSSGGQDLVVAKLDADGNHLWSNLYDQANPRKLRCDSSGDLIVTGSFVGSLDFGSGTPLPDSNGNHFIAKLDGDGAHLWSKNYPVVAVSDIEVGPGDDITFVGAFNGAPDFGGGTLSGAGVEDLFCARLTADGDYVWSIGAGSPGVQGPTGLGVDAAGYALLIGFFEGSLDLGGGPLVALGGPDLFVAKLGP